MDEYPEELRTPPVALVALVGVAELHPQISMFLHTEQPPINTLALPDFSKVPVIGGKERLPADARIPPPKGILKADWLQKHRTKVPAVLAVLLDREQVNGDPQQWLQVCTNIDNIKNVIRGRNTKLVVAIVQPTLHGEINDDRMTALRKRAELDAKSCLIFISHDPTELRRSLARLGSVLGELSGTFYKEESRRVKARLDKKLWSAPETAVRFNFKMGYYAEFRRDWAAALRFYETAYTVLQEIVNAPAETQSLQRTVEIKAVAELLHFKVSTLLLHSGKEAEAVKWFKQHTARFKKLVGPLEGVFMHLAWVSQQYHVFGDLLKTSLSTASPASGVLLFGSGLSERELQPGYYYQVAAAYMTERRQSFERAYTTFESFDDPDLPDILVGESAGPPMHVGQGPCVLTRPPGQQSPTAEEYLRHVILKERQFSHSRAAISLLTKAHEQYKLIQAARMIYYIGTDMGREYFHAGEYENAKRLFDSVAGMYRKEGWVVLLAASLGYLRECSKQLGILKEHLEYSLELAALPMFGEGPAPYSTRHRRDLQNEIISNMQGSDGETSMRVSETAPVALEIDLVSPLRSVLSVCVAFHEQSVKPGETTLLTVSLLTRLPLPVVLQEIEIIFNQVSCNVVLKHSSDQALQLEPCQWKRFEVNVAAGKSGKLECLSAVARVGPNATIRCQVESPASREPDPLWQFEQGFERYPMKDMNLAVLGQKIVQVEEPEALVDLELEADSVGLLGESFPVRIHVKSKGHAIDAGELQVSTVEAASTELLSPTTPASAPPASANVFFPGNLQDGKDEPALWELQGSVKVPRIESGESWSTVVILRWTEARPVSVVVGLGYKHDGAGGETHQLWVRKTLVLKCEEPLGINCRYVGPSQRDTFLPASLASSATVLPLNETSMMVVSARNTCSVPVVILPVVIEERDSAACQVRRLEQPNGRLKNSCVNQVAEEGTEVLPGEAFKQILSVHPVSPSSSLDIGVLALKWERRQQQRIPELSEVTDVSSITDVLITSNTDPVGVLQRYATTRVTLPPIAVEEPSLVVSLQRPAYALLSTPLVISWSIQNKSNVAQEVKFGVLDSQSFLVSGASKGSLSLLPLATELVSLRLVPIACGMHQLPQVVLTSVQLNATYQSLSSRTQLFVFPSQPQLQPRYVEDSDTYTCEAHGGFY